MLNRRKFMAGASAVSLLAVLAACGAGGDDGEGAASSKQVPLSDKQTVQMLNYQGWMGADVVKNYTAKNPQITIKESDLPSGGVGGIVTLLRQNSGAYDFALLGAVSAGTAAAQGILADFDESKVPNIDLIPEEYRKAYPWGIPLEQGKVGIIYRKDKISDPPTSWAELFDQLPELDGRVAFPDYDLDVFSMALLAMGEDINTTDISKLEAAADKISEAKPHLKAFLGSDRVKALTDGSLDMVIGYDYETAGVLGVDKNIGWIAPSEGVPAYLDGWPIFKDSTRQAAVLDFMNFQLEPEQYADFINTTGASYLGPEIEDLLSSDVLDNPAIAYNPDVKVHYEQYTNGEVNAKRSELWEQIKAS